MKRILMLAAATLVLVLPASSSAATISVKIVGNAFQPAKITVDSGDVVQWTNNTSAQPAGRRGRGRLRVADAQARPVLLVHVQDGRLVRVPRRVCIRARRARSRCRARRLRSRSTSARRSSRTGARRRSRARSRPATRGQTVTITSRPEGASSQQVATVTTGSDGSFSDMVKPTIQTDYVATWKSTQSQTASVQVRPRVRLTHYTATRLFVKVASSISYQGHLMLHPAALVGGLGHGQAADASARTRAASSPRRTSAATARTAPC